MMEFINTHWDDILITATAVIAAASAIANLTPTDVDNKAVALLTKGINFLALNFKKKDK